MELGDYPNITWDVRSRGYAWKESMRLGRDRRTTSFFKCLETLDNLKATIQLDGDSFWWKISGLDGVFLLGDDGEWRVDV